VTRVLAIDVGAVRIGLAISDPDARIATPLETVAGRPRAAAIARIVELLVARDIRQIVVGLPLDLDGREGQAVRRVRTFVDALREHTALPIEEWDERFTSVAAERSLVEADVRRAKRKTVIDQVAATLLLQGYLDAKRPPS
jgi:putative holliday junction resolvase